MEMSKSITRVLCQDDQQAGDKKERGLIIFIAEFKWKEQTRM